MPISISLPLASRAVRRQVVGNVAGHRLVAQVEQGMGLDATGLLFGATPPRRQDLELRGEHDNAIASVTCHRGPDYRCWIFLSRCASSLADVDVFGSKCQ